MTKDKKEEHKKYSTGLNKFRGEFFEKNKGKYKNIIDANEPLMQAWNKMTKRQKDSYKKDTIKRNVAKEEKNSSKMLMNTRCSPGQLKEVVDFIKCNKRLKERVISMGFGSILNFCCDRLPRELCEVLINSYDPPTSTLAARGRQVVVYAVDVHSILGIPHGGKSVILDVDSDSLVQMKEEFQGVALTDLNKRIVSGGGRQI